MKRVIREEVFETASSSIHTVVYNPKRMKKNNLTMEDGYVIADFGEFGTDEHTYKTQDEKLSYLLTELYYINNYETNIEENWNFEHLEEAIKDYDSTVKGIKVSKEKEPYIDHQSTPDFGESKFVNYWDKGSIQAFLFNNDLWIHTDYD